MNPLLHSRLLLFGVACAASCAGAPHEDPAGGHPQVARTPAPALEVPFEFRSDPEGARIYLVDEEQWEVDGGQDLYHRYQVTHLTSVADAAARELRSWLQPYARNEGVTPVTLTVADYAAYYVGELDGVLRAVRVRPGVQSGADLYFGE